MAEQTTINALKDLNFFHWRGTPQIDQDASASATILKVSAAPTDKDGAVITGDFLMTVESLTTGEVEAIYVPASAVSADGLTLGTSLIPVVRGLNPTGNDLTGSSSFAQTLQAGSPVSCSVDSILLYSLLRALTQQLACRLRLDTRITFIGAGIASCPPFANEAAANAALTPENGDSYYDTALGNTRTYQAGAWNTDGNTGVSNATEAAAGKVELGTLAEQGAHTETGSAGPLVVQCKNTVKESAVYTPAYLTGGGSAESTVSVWDSVSDGSERGTVDGTAYNVDGMDFTSITDMDGVAAVKQAAWRAATGTLLTIVWDTDHFVYTSANTTSSSEFSVLTTSTGTVGTDISGAGAGTYSDSDTGNGTATAAVLDKTQDENKAVVVNPAGAVDGSLMPQTPTSYPPSGGAITGEIRMWSAAAAPAGWLLCNAAEVSRATYATLFAVISTTYGIGDGSTTFNLPDFRGRTPIGAGTGDATDATAHAVADKEGTEGIDSSHTHLSPYTGFGGSGSQGVGKMVVSDNGGTAPANTDFASQDSTTGSGGSATLGILQPSLTINFIIKT